MSQSLSKIYIHLVWHIKYNSVHLRPQDRQELYAYMGGIIKSLESIPIIINGTHNHVHVLFVMSKNVSLAECAKKIKMSSSRWLKTKSEYYRHFAWQGGYGAFSVSQSLYERTYRYIENQENHHKKKTFREEYISFLKTYNVEFDEKYTFTD